MEIITIPQLKLGQLQILTESTLKITEPLSLLADSNAGVQAAFDRFKQGMTKESAASDKRTLDKTRDALIAGFLLTVKGDSYYPYENESQNKTMNDLKRAADGYGFTSNRLPYDEQTAAIDNLLKEIEKIDLTGLDHLSRWISVIQTANENFKAGSEDFLKSVVTEKATDSASAVAPSLLAELENLYTMLFAHATVSKDGSLSEAYQKISVLVDSYR